MMEIVDRDEADGFHRFSRPGFFRRARSGPGPQRQQGGETTHRPAARGQIAGRGWFLTGLMMILCGHDL
jgi:hypothetical protein